jgi:hypothetical protein
MAGPTPSPVPVRPLGVGHGRWVRLREGGLVARRAEEEAGQVPSASGRDSPDRFR